MPFQRLQRLSVRTFACLRRLLSRGRDWVETHPRLAAWLYPSEAESAEANYRAFNGRYFADFHEQERMLADRPRMNFYAAAIARHIQPGDRVIDLGTGTGILAAFASRRGARQVYAIDHSEILEHARALAQANAIANVEFISTHSSAFTLEAPVDVILHEQMGDCLFDESMVANITDLRDRLLKPGGLILPSIFELYCEPIQVRDDRVVPFIWELDVHGYDYSSLERHRPQDPSYYRLCSSDRGLVDHFLGEPEPVIALNLHTVTDAGLPHAVRYSRRIAQAGRLDGYAVYFKARVDRDLVLDTGPLNPARAPHWGYRILRTERLQFAAGDTIDIDLKVERWNDLNTWTWSQTKRPRESRPAGEPVTQHRD